PVRNLIGTRLAPWRRSVRTSGPPVSTTGRLGSATGDRSAGRSTEPPGERPCHLAGYAREGRGRARLRSGDALVAVMEPAGLGGGPHPRGGWRVHLGWPWTVVVQRLMRARGVVVGDVGV